MDEVAERLVDRMEDCTHTFSKALILGGSSLHVLKALSTKHSTTLQSAVVLDTSQSMLDKVYREYNTFSSKKDMHVDFLLADPQKEILPVDPGIFDGMHASYILNVSSLVIIQLLNGTNEPCVFCSCHQLSRPSLG